MTTNDWKQLAQSLSATLSLKHPPLAITFAQETPESVVSFDKPMPEPYGDGRTGRVSAGCVFWVEGASRTFATSPEDHFNCSVGSVTHGLKKLDEVMGNEDVKCLLESEWVSPEEAMSLPVVTERPGRILYGPLAETPVDPDVVLLRVNGFQAMVIHDAFSEVAFAGKPQCHIVPMAKEQDRIAISTGCMLSRVRTGMGPDEMTCTLPARRLAEVVGKLEARKRANALVAGYASEDRARFS